MCCRPGIYAQVVLFLLPLILIPTVPVIVKSHGNNKALPAEELAGISLGIYAASINCLALLMFGLDKCFAISDEWRIAEAGLMLLICEGGIVGSWLGVLCFCHKISKGEFLGLAAICCIVGVVFLAVYFGVLYAIFQ